MKLFSDTAIALLNSLYGSSQGAWVKAADVVIDDTTTLYFVDNLDAITFNGHTYTPLPMGWKGIGQNASMALPSIQITVPNVTGQIDAFMDGAELAGNDVILWILHLDLLGTVSDADKVNLHIALIEWNWQSAVFTLSINLGLSDQLPKHVMSRTDFPGIPDSYRRASIL